MISYDELPSGEDRPNPYPIPEELLARVRIETGSNTLASETYLGKARCRIVDGEANVVALHGPTDAIPCPSGEISAGSPYCINIALPSLYSGAYWEISEEGPYSRKQALQLAHNPDSFPPIHPYWHDAIYTREYKDGPGLLVFARINGIHPLFREATLDPTEDYGETGCFISPDYGYRTMALDTITTYYPGGKYSRELLAFNAKNNDQPLEPGETPGTVEVVLWAGHLRQSRFLVHLPGKKEAYVIRELADESVFGPTDLHARTSEFTEVFSPHPRPLAAFCIALSAQ
jgi:hypothetical protein